MEKIKVCVCVWESERNIATNIIEQELNVKGFLSVLLQVGLMFMSQLPLSTSTAWGDSLRTSSQTDWFGLRGVCVCVCLSLHVTTHGTVLNRTLLTFFSPVSKMNSHNEVSQNYSADWTTLSMYCIEGMAWERRLEGRVLPGVSQWTNCMKRS